MTKMRGFTGTYKAYGYVYYEDMTVEYHMENRSTPDGLEWQLEACLIHVGDARFEHEYGKLPDNIISDIWQCHSDSKW